MKKDTPQQKRHIPKPTNFLDTTIRFAVFKMSDKYWEIVDSADTSDDAKIKAFNLKSKNPNNVYSVGVVEIIGTI